MSAAGDQREQRLDQWLWFSRLVKSRTLAQALIERGKVRINRERVARSSHTVKPGDTLTVSMGPHIRVVQVLAIGARRGPATEAAGLYTLIGGPAIAGLQKAQVEADGAGAPAVRGIDPTGRREPGSGRPTKRDRRRIDRLKDTLGDL